MRIRKRSVPLPFSSLCPAILPDPQLHYVLSSEERLAPDNKVGRGGAEEEQQKEAKAKGPKPRRPNGGDPSSVAVKEEEERTHLDDHQPQSQTSSNPSPPPLPLKLEEKRRSSDLQLTIIRVKDGWICSNSVGGGGGIEEQKKINEYESCCGMCPNTPSQAQKGLPGEEETKGKRCCVLVNNSRNANSLGAKAGDDEIGANGLLSSSSYQGEVVGRWCEGEKAFPLKKGRGSCFDRKASKETTTTDKEKKMKTKTNKRCVHPEDDDDDDDDGGSNNNSMRKRGNRGGVVPMEGSRCSRVNGRGWRCCQPTLVGYSLCEHHLGKGRLRNMKNTSRTRASSIIDGLIKPRWALSSSSSSINKDEDEEEEKPLMSTKKRKSFVW